MVVFHRPAVNLANVTFDDTTGKDVDTATALPSGSAVRGEQALSAFTGLATKGTWTVEIFDPFSAATGTVRNASLSVGTK